MDHRRSSVFIDSFARVRPVLWLRMEVHHAIGSGELRSPFSVWDNCNRINRVMISRIQQNTRQICDFPWN